MANAVIGIFGAVTILLVGRVTVHGTEALKLEEIDIAVKNYYRANGKYPEDDVDGTWLFHLLSYEGAAGMPAKAEYSLWDNRKKRSVLRYKSTVDPELMSVARDLVAIDPWGNDIKLTVTSAGPLIYSYGEDGKDDNGEYDDISNMYGWNRLCYEWPKHLLVVVVFVGVLTVVVLILTVCYRKAIGGGCSSRDPCEKSP